jgi:signal transduction histidine kinase
MGPMANSFFLRLAAALLALGVGFNVLMASAFLAPAGRERAQFNALPTPEQAAAITTVLERAPVQERERLITALNSPGLHVALVDVLPDASTRPGVAAPTLASFFTRYDAIFSDRDLHFDIRRRRIGERIFDGDRHQPWAPARIYVRLQDGPWVMLEPARGALLDTIIVRGLTFGAFGGVIVLIGLWLAVRQTTRPIANLADNAREFAERLDAPPIAETGPREVRALALSFNIMKTRIRDLVGDRTRVLAAIAHDLRTYLTRLRLRTDFIDDPEQRTRAEKDLDEMAALIDDTLLFARAQHAKGESANVAEVVKAFVSTRQELSQPVTIVGGLDNARTVLSPIALRRVLANLTDNAVRYGGAARISLTRDGDVAFLVVDDDGPGIPESDLIRVTAPFERLEPSRARDYGGAGLGLSIVRALLEVHGGALILCNRQPHGLLARAELPLAQSESSARMLNRAT